MFSYFLWTVSNRILWQVSNDVIYKDDMYSMKLFHQKPMMKFCEVTAMQHIIV